MFWNVSARVQIVENYMTQELTFNRTIELPYTQHEADCENQMGVINRWLERKKVAMAMLEQIGSDALRQIYVADFREAQMCYEYNLRELDHLIRHNSISERIHFIYEREPVGMCETCDKADAANVKHYHNYEPFYTARHTNEDLTVTMRDYVKCSICEFVSYTVNA
tara:strand:- start:149 stop:646 length:498 start_codon:yes stop_codon:yes gene_type:complete